MGIVSSLGIGVAENLDRLRNCKTGISPITFLPTTHKNEFVAGELKLPTSELEALCGKPGLNRTVLLSILAAREALKQAGTSAGARTGLISSTTVGGMTNSEMHYKAFMEGKKYPDFIEEHFSGKGTDHLADDLQISDFVTTLSTACSSAANAVMLGARLIKNGTLDRCVVGGSDALSVFTFNGFNTLMILDNAWCRPFDATRKGLNLGEGAAYLVLESEALHKKNGNRSLATLAGYSNANDAFHQTASSAEGMGAQLAMRKALQVAGLQTTQIDYINAHGTGTPNNDSSEAMAMQGVFGADVPLFSSTKAYTGHTLAAAASIEAVFSILSLNYDLMFPSLNHSSPMEDVVIKPVTTLTEKKLTHVMSNSFGFGGNFSSLIFSRN